MKRGVLFLLVFALLVGQMALAQEQILRFNGKGRLSPASLDLDACGCPTTFGPPVCEQRTAWSITKVADTGDLTDPDNEPYSFTITVTEGATSQELRGTGELIVTNSGDQTTYLSSVALALEEKSAPGQGDAPGPSGKNWKVLLIATEIKEPNNCAGTAVTCYGDLDPTAGSDLAVRDPFDAMARLKDIPIPPTLDNDGDGLRDEDPELPADPSKITGGCAVIDNDGDGLYDEDPIDGVDNDGDGKIDEDDPDDDGDGLVDEDGPCEDAVRLTFEYIFDISGLNIEGPGDGIVPSNDDLRLDLITTFVAGGRRGGTCTADVDCDGNDESHVRSVQQRHRFDPPACNTVCDCVDLVDDGAFADDPSCVAVTTNTINETICAQGEGTQTIRQISGTVTCAGGECQTFVRNTATLSCEDPSLIEGSPASASFGVGCTEEPPGLDFCTQTQGGWGSNPAGNNPGACLHQWFGTVFPSGLVVGDQDGADADGCYAIELNSAQAVTDFLPQGGTPAVLMNDYIDPSCPGAGSCQATEAGVFAGQITAATINVAFSDYNANVGGLTCGGGRTFPGGLGDLVYKADCVVAGLAGMSVRDVLALAHGVISGCTALPAGVTVSDISDALAALNENFVDCQTDEGCLELPGGGALMRGDELDPQRSSSDLPKQTQLLQNNPNPFNPTTAIQFELSERSLVELTIYDVSGRMIRRLVSESMPAGRHSVTWDGRNSAGVTVATGVYFYRMTAGDFVATKRMVLMK
jgi:hypothetical protein